MARTKQAARASAGGRAPKHVLSTQSARSPLEVEVKEGPGTAADGSKRTTGKESLFEKHFDPKYSRPYYVNCATGLSLWALPPGARIKATPVVSATAHLTTPGISTAAHLQAEAAKRQREYQASKEAYAQKLVARQLATKRKKAEETRGQEVAKRRKRSAKQHDDDGTLASKTSTPKGKSLSTVLPAPFSTPGSMKMVQTTPSFTGGVASCGEEQMMQDALKAERKKGWVRGLRAAIRAGERVMSQLSASKDANAARTAQFDRVRELVFQCREKISPHENKDEKARRLAMMTPEGRQKWQLECEAKTARKRLLAEAKERKEEALRKKAEKREEKLRAEQQARDEAQAAKEREEKERAAAAVEAIAENLDFSEGLAVLLKKIYPGAELSPMASIVMHHLLAQTATKLIRCASASAESAFQLEPTQVAEAIRTVYHGGLVKFALIEYDYGAGTPKNRPVFPTARVGEIVRAIASKKGSPDCISALTATLEYISAEILELSGKGKKLIGYDEVKSGIAADGDVSSMFPSVKITDLDYDSTAFSSDAFVRARIAQFRKEIFSSSMTPTQGSESWSDFLKRFGVVEEGGFFFHMSDEYFDNYYDEVRHAIGHGHDVVERPFPLEGSKWPYVVACDAAPDFSDDESESEEEQRAERLQRSLFFPDSDRSTFACVMQLDAYGRCPTQKAAKCFRTFTLERKKDGQVSGMIDWATEDRRVLRGAVDLKDGNRLTFDPSCVDEEFMLDEETGDYTGDRALHVELRRVSEQQEFHLRTEVRNRYGYCEDSEAGPTERWEVQEGDLELRIGEQCPIGIMDCPDRHSYHVAIMRRVPSVKEAAEIRSRAAQARKRKIEEVAGAELAEVRASARRKAEAKMKQELAAQAEELKLQMQKQLEAQVNEMKKKMAKKMAEQLAAQEEELKKLRPEVHDLTMDDDEEQDDAPASKDAGSYNMTPVPTTLSLHQKLVTVKTENAERKVQNKELAEQLELRSLQARMAEGEVRDTTRQLEAAKKEAEAAKKKAEAEAKRASDVAEDLEDAQELVGQLVQSENNKMTEIDEQKKKVDGVKKRMEEEMKRAAAAEKKALAAMEKAAEAAAEKKRLAAEVDRLEDLTVCVVCMEAPKEIMLMPCRHALMCSSCAETLTHCPTCRLEIASKVKIFTQ